MTDEHLKQTAMRLHSKCLTARPDTETLREVVRLLERVPTAREATLFRRVWASEHAAWEDLVGKDVEQASTLDAERRAKADELLTYVEHWCDEHEIGPHEQVRDQLRGMLATDLLRFAVGVCSRLMGRLEPTSPKSGAEGSVWGSLEDLRRDGFTGAMPPPARAPTPSWKDAHHIVAGRSFLVRTPSGLLDYVLVGEAMAELEQMFLSRATIDSFNKLIEDAAVYEDHNCTMHPGHIAPTDGNVLVTYNKVAAKGPVTRLALVVAMCLAGIGDTHKVRGLYVGEMIRRGIFSLSAGENDPLLLGSHPAAGTGSTAS